MRTAEFLRFALLAVFVAGGAAACGGDGGNKPCNVADDTGCEGGQVCEETEGQGPTCFDPVEIRGKVFDLSNKAAVGGAKIVAIDANGSPVSSVAVSAADGTYELAVPTRRTPEGAPIGATLTLRADAKGYATFPSGIRQPIPIDTGDATAEGENGGYFLMATVTDIGLLPLADTTATNEISGTVELPATGATGVLVVAESTGATPVGYTAIADREGKFHIFNVPSGSYNVTAYASGVVYKSAPAGLGGNFHLENLRIDLDPNVQPGTVMGSISIVNAPGGLATSVILVLESTFNENIARGEAPPGFRAPAPGMAANITGPYMFVGVPPGKYVVLAAFENDQLVRDPSDIGGTATQHITVEPGAVTTVDGFKVTEALAIQSPGAANPQKVTSAPTLSWVDDSGEDYYEVQVFDAFGNEVWTHTEPKHTGDDPAVPYGGPLEPGMYYQFRATSFDGAGSPLSRTEDLRGVFFTDPPAAP